MAQTTINAMEVIVGKDYLSAVCDINLVKAILSFCITVIFALFGADHVAILVVLGLWLIDTTTGIIYAIGNSEYKSSIGFKKGGVKLYVIGATFVTMTLLAHSHPELAIAPQITASFFILNETYSIIENLNKLKPNTYFGAILELIGSAESKVVERIKTLNKKNK